MARFPFRVVRDGQRLVVSQSSLIEGGALLGLLVLAGVLTYGHAGLEDAWRRTFPTRWPLGAVLVAALGYLLYRAARPRRVTFDAEGDRLLSRDQLVCPLSQVDRLLVETRWTHADGSSDERLLAILKDGRRLTIGIGAESAIDELAWAIARFTRLPVRRG